MDGDEGVHAFERRIAEQTARLALEEEADDTGTGVMTSQLRHFIIQVSSPGLARVILTERNTCPDLYSSTSSKSPARCYRNPEGTRWVITYLKADRQFHLRAYVLLTGAYTLHLSRTLLALFSSDPYTHPTADSTWDEDALRPHLTNTCLQTDALGETKPVEELVKLFWELEGLSALSRDEKGYVARGRVNKDWLEGTFGRVGEVIAESVKAGVECGSFGLQLMPNAFEVSLKKKYGHLYTAYDDRFSG